ncbi:MAG: cupredoxin family protein [Pseudomonadales bacterium]|nr:cupredoxin family protein [Pseudomonadales bacterium]
MKKLTILTSAVLIGVLSAPVYAGGAHDGGHHGAYQTKAKTHSNHTKNKEADHGSHAHTESAVGKPANSLKPSKTIQVETMDTMRFTFSEELNIKNGDVIEFVVTNNGKIPHEFSIGNEKEQNSHRDMMRKMPNMVHEDGNTVTVKPGEKKTLTWQFTGNDEVVFACNIPGHFEAGMKAMAGISHKAGVAGHHH